MTLKERLYKQWDERRGLRYKCFRLKSEAEGVSGADDMEDVREIVEALPLFDLYGGWPEFSRTWDFPNCSPEYALKMENQDLKRFLDEFELYRIVQRAKTVEQEWQETLERVVPDARESLANIRTEGSA